MSARRDERDQQVISLGLHIIRNLLSIKDLVVDDSATGEKLEMSRLQVSVAEPAIAGILR